MQDAITDKRMVNIQMIKGDTLSFGVLLKGAGADLSSAYFTCYAERGANTNLFQKSLGNGISKVSEEGDDRTYRVRVAPADTSSLTAGKYYYDFKIGLNSDVFTIMLGILEIGA